MSIAKITIRAFDDYMSQNNDDLFKNFIMPDGIEKEILIKNIINESSDFEVLYSNPYYMQELIGVWCSKNSRTFTKWINALNIEYEPLENYDRKEEWNDTSSNIRKNTNSQKIDNSTNGTITSSGTDISENEKSAFDSSTYSPYDKVTDTSNNTNTSIGTNNSTQSGQLNETDNGSLHRVGRTHGNIGVTTSQQMLQSELDIAKWNIYNQITDLFINEFCILVYV